MSALVTHRFTRTVGASLGERREQRIEAVLVIVANTVHKEGGRPIDPTLKSGLEILKDTARVEVFSQLVVKSGDIKLQPNCVSTEAFTGWWMAALVDAPVHIPEPALRAGGLHSFGRQHAHGVSVHDREMAHDHEQFIAEPLANAIDDPHRCLTGGTFEVCVLD